MVIDAQTVRAYYFAYATYMDTELVARRMPGAKIITLARAANSALEFRQASGDGSRGWCHLASDGTTWGRTAYGVVLEVDSVGDTKRFDHNGPRCLTVYGDDGQMYDCWTYCLTDPGARMRVPDYEWRHLKIGISRWNLPHTYLMQLREMYELARPCPDAARANPVMFPSSTDDESDD